MGALKGVFCMEELKTRLIEFARKQHDMGQTRFEDYCEIPHGTISAIKEKGPTASILTRIAVKCPELDLNWLFRGEPLRKNEHPTPAPSVSIGSIQTVNIGNWNELVRLLKEKA